MRRVFFGGMATVVMASIGPLLADTSADSASQSPAQTISSQPPAVARVQSLAASATPHKLLPIAQPVAPTRVISSIGDPDMIICKEINAFTGSRLGATRECHTKREWDKRLSQNQLNVFHQQREAMAVGAPPGAGGGVSLGGVQRGSGH